MPLYLLNFDLNHFTKFNHTFNIFSFTDLTSTSGVGSDVGAGAAISAGAASVKAAKLDFFADAVVLVTLEVFVVPAASGFFSGVVGVITIEVGAVV